MVPHSDRTVIETMDFDVLPTGKLEPLTRISPSRFTSLQLCPLREILAANNKPRLLPSSPSAQLGTVVHKLIEAGSRGQIKNEQDMLSCWEASCGKVEQEMQKSSLEHHLIPLASSANNYEIKKIMAFNVVRKCFSDGSVPVKTESARKLEPEVWMETEDGKVGGKIDLIKRTQKGAEIIDYKTGAVTENLPDERSIKQEYSQQLKLYAALYFSVHGEWPVRLALIGMDSVEYEIPFTHDECLQLLDEAKHELDELNQLIASGLPDKDFSRPSPEACRYCSYRPGCKAYWQKRQDNAEWPADVRGRITERKILGNGFIRIILENNGKKFVIRGLSPERHSFLKEESNTVMFCNLGHDSAEGFFIERPLTAGYKL